MNPGFHTVHWRQIIPWGNGRTGHITPLLVSHSLTAYLGSPTSLVPLSPAVPRRDEMTFQIQSHPCVATQSGSDLAKLPSQACRRQDLSQDQTWVEGKVLKLQNTPETRGRSVVSAAIPPVKPKGVLSCSGKGKENRDPRTDVNSVSCILSDWDWAFTTQLSASFSKYTQLSWILFDKKDCFHWFEELRKSRLLLTPVFRLKNLASYKIVIKFFCLFLQVWSRNNSYGKGPIQLGCKEHTLLLLEAGFQGQ